MTGKEFYYLSGNEQKGPFTIQELQREKITRQTLVWCQGMDDWQKLEEVPELSEILKNKPPAPPNADKINTKNKKSNNSTLSKFKPSPRLYKLFVYWCVFQLFALLGSYSGLPYLNQELCFESDSHDVEEVWPFTEIFDFIDEEPNGTGWCGYSDNKYFGYYIQFNGFFYDYDYTEFIFYFGGSLLLVGLISFSKKIE